ncbi:MAG: hypothetical protein L6Q99_11115 [Planctomycetes bacterium]|nr:hypothetical protein [Planctomycetota bacterium]
MRRNVVRAATIGALATTLGFIGFLIARRPTSTASSPERPMAPETSGVSSAPISPERAALPATATSRINPELPTDSLPESTSGLVVRVVTPSGSPVADADIVHFSESGVQRLGRVDTEGTFPIPAHLGHQGAVQARKRGFWSEVAHLDDCASDMIELRVVPGGVIRGVVVDATGRAVTDGSIVMAWPDSLRAPTSRHTSVGLFGDPYVPTVATAGDGSFIFEDLDPRPRYSLAAGGAGRLTPAVVTGLVVDGDPVQLRLSALYGVRCRLADATGGPVRSSRQATADARVTMQLVRAAPGVQKVPHWLAALSGLVPPAAHSEPYEALMLYSAESHPEVVGPIRCSVNLPGYLPLEIELFAPPVSSTLTEARIELTPTESRRGSIVVQLDSPQVAGSIHARAQQSLLQLHLALGTGAERASYDLDGASVGEYRIDDVPVGDYVARVASRVSSFVWPPVEENPVRIRVEETECARIVVDASPLGCLRLELTDEMGLAYSGPAVVVILPAAGTATTSEFFNELRELDFDRAPYSIGALLPGAYRVGFRFPKARPSEEGNVEVAVTCGTEVRKQFVLSVDH